MWGRVALAAAIVAAVLGVAIGLVVVFAPTYTECQAVQLTPSGPVPPSPPVCVARSLWELHGRKGFPAPYGFLLAWSLAPILAVVGVIARVRRRASFGVALVGLALGH